jgi:phage terminase small subunit
MARIPFPTAIQEAKGAYIMTDTRKNKHELKPSGELSQTPPTCLKTATEKKVWREFVRGLPPGVGTAWDRRMTISLVKLLAKEEDDTLSCPERAQMITLAAKFGMTPSDRAKFAIPQEPKSKLDAFLKKPPKTA